MTKPSDIRPVGATLYFLPIQTRVPLKFGPEVTTSVTCARACLTVVDRRGRTAVGWGETPLSVQGVWPCALGYEVRHAALKGFCQQLAAAWADFETIGHPMETGHDFHEHALPKLLARFNAGRKEEPVPWLAALVCCSLFDLALHDAYGQLLQRPVYETYSAEFMNRDLAAFLTPAEGSDISFHGKLPADYLSAGGVLTFAPGEGVKLLTVQVNGDLQTEPNESFVVNLSGAVQATIGDAQGRGTVVNDDGTVSLTVGDPTVTEGDSG